MIAIIQRVLKGSVKIDDKKHAEIGKGYVILVGFCKDDKEEYVDKMANKIKNLRIFEDEQGKMGKSISDVQGEILLVPNFTLCASLKKGRRPSFDNAMEAANARKLFEVLEFKLKNFGINVKTGMFGVKMKVEITNDGPVTFIITNEDLSL